MLRMFKVMFYTLNRNIICVKLVLFMSVYFNARLSNVWPYKNAGSGLVIVKAIPQCSIEHKSQANKRVRLPRKGIVWR